MGVYSVLLSNALMLMFVCKYNWRHTECKKTSHLSKLICWCCPSSVPGCRIFIHQYWNILIRFCSSSTAAAYKAGKIQNNPFAGRDGPGAMIPPPASQAGNILCKYQVLMSPVCVCVCVCVCGILHFKHYTSLTLWIIFVWYCIKSYK